MLLDRLLIFHVLETVWRRLITHDVNVIARSTSRSVWYSFIAFFTFVRNSAFAILFIWPVLLISTVHGGIRSSSCCFSGRFHWTPILQGATPSSSGLLYLPLRLSPCIQFERQTFIDLRYWWCYCLTLFCFRQASEISCVILRLCFWACLASTEYVHHLEWLLTETVRSVALLTVVDCCYYFWESENEHCLSCLLNTTSYHLNRFDVMGGVTNFAIFGWTHAGLFLESSTAVPWLRDYICSVQLVANANNSCRGWDLLLQVPTMRTWLISFLARHAGRWLAQTWTEIDSVRLVVVAACTIRQVFNTLLTARSVKDFNTANGTLSAPFLGCDGF